MKHILFFTVVLTLIATVCFANTAPVVSDVTVIRRIDGSGMVDITYKLSDADNDKCTITVQVSDDGGSTWTVPATTFLPISAVGANIGPGNRYIAWNSKTDLLGVSGSNYRVKIIADDNYDPSGMVWVPVNDSGAGMKDINGNSINQGGFSGYMSKYETTNAQYCQFLNTAKASDQITVYNNIVYATSDTSHSQPYFSTQSANISSQIAYSNGIFSVCSRSGQSMANHPVVLVSWYGAVAFCNYFGYHLPTEWEWQAIADYTGNYIYGCGMTIDTGKANYGYINPLGLSLPYTTPVGYYDQVYGYGLCDMAGNVWEWTSSVSNGNCRVLCGGGWGSGNYAYCAVAYKLYNYGPHSMYHDTGFRVCRNIEPSGMVWVSINDSGAGMKDINGNPINQGGFSGYMSKYETTNAQYCQYLNAAKAANQITVYNNIVYVTSDTSHSQPYYNFAGAGYTGYGVTNGGAARINWTGDSFTVDSGFENHPVTYVSWYGATAFASYYGWQTPTEWEWQAVADFDGTYAYAHGPGTINNSLANYLYNSIHPYGTTAVGSYGTIHGYGMCDMAGNVWEWTNTVSGSYRVIRGGCWSHPDNYCSVSYRDDGGPSTMTFDWGFRVCRLTSGATGYWMSNIFTVNNRDAITISATNNWDGTVTVMWTERGGVRLVRQEADNPANEIGWSLSGSSKVDKFQLSELKPVDGHKKKYIYIVKDLSGTEIARSSEVMPDIVVVLVKGYSFFWGTGDNPNYWTSDANEQSKGLVKSVHGWFEDPNRNITCWDASSVLNGRRNVKWNANTLNDFISQNRIGDYEEAKVNLVGHSMGGLISRRYAFNNDTVVKNTFCIETPHTGSPLALVLEILAGEARYDLKPKTLEKFNKDYSKLVNTHSTYSGNHKQVLNSSFLDLGARTIDTCPLFFDTSSGASSDGASPKASSMGYIRANRRSPLHQKVIFASVWDCNLDHNSSYRHSRVLNKIVDWLGYPQPADLLLKMQANQAVLTNEEPQAPLYFIAGFTGDFNSSQSVSKTVQIGGGQKAYFRAISSDSNTVFTLTNPYSLVIDPCVATTDPNINFTAQGGVLLYEIIKPNAGTWTMTLTTTVADPNVQYGLTAFEDQQITLSADSSSEWINIGQTILLRAELSANAGAITGATVSGIITLPNATTQNITFYDDGTHGDQTANDGTYSYLLSSISLEGEYNVDVHAIGSGGSFERAATTSFTASVANIVINGAITDQGIDTNGNGKFDVLRITVPVNVLAANDYRLTASLTDSQGEFISLINSGLVHLALDANVISTDTPAKDIIKHNVNGPYTFKNIQVSDGNTGLVIASAIDQNTAAYQIGQLEPLDFDGDGLPDIMEQGIGTDPNKTDTDEDGATDYQEVSVDGNSTAYNPQTDSNPLVIDTDGDTMPDGYEISYGLNPLVDDTQGDVDGDGLTNIQEYTLHTSPDKIDTDGDGRNDTWEIDNLTNPLVYETYTSIAGDISKDGSVDIYDLGIMAGQWLSVPAIPSADIAPPPSGDGIVNFLDFALFSQHWLEGVGP